jgi:hypothetical protein
MLLSTRYRSTRRRQARRRRVGCRALAPGRAQLAAATSLAIQFCPCPSHCQAGAHRTVKRGKDVRRKMGGRVSPGTALTALLGQSAWAAAALDKSMRKVRIMGVCAPTVAATTWVPAQGKSGPSGRGTEGVGSAPGCDPHDHCHLFRRDSILAPAYKADKAVARLTCGVRSSAEGRGWAYDPPRNGAAATSMAGTGPRVDAQGRRRLQEV